MINNVSRNTIFSQNKRIITSLLYNNYFLIYIAVFIIFSFNVLPSDILIAAAVIIFILAPTEKMTYLYLFSLPWMYVARFSFGLTLSLIQSTVFIAKSIIKLRKVVISPFGFVYPGYLFFCAVMNLINSSSLTGLSFVFYFLISEFIIQENFNNEESRDYFWRNALFTVLVSCLISAIYGYINSTSVARWISGMGYASQLYGTLGTTRFGIYLCISILYALFYIENRIIKTIVLIFLSIGILLTISMTALILMLGIYLAFFLSTGKLTVKKISILILITMSIAIVILNWGSISQLSLVKPVSLRIERVIYLTKSGDYSNATSGRIDLAEAYYDKFINASYLSKLFGSFTLTLEGTSYSHNSYIDMLNYFGLLGMFLSIILQIKRLYSFRNYYERKMYYFLKATIIIPAATVSIFSAQFWQIWFFI